MRKKETKEDSREIKENIAEKYSRVSRVISRFSKWISAWMDRILFSQRYGKLVALLLGGVRLCHREHRQQRFLAV